MTYKLKYKDQYDILEFLPNNEYKTLCGMYGNVKMKTDDGCLVLTYKDNILTYIRNNKKENEYNFVTNKYNCEKLFIVATGGGLGNQLFQYSFAKYLKSLELYKDSVIKFENNYFTKERSRKFQLDFFNINSIEKASIKETLICKYCEFENALKNTYPIVYNRRILGYWQNWKYVKPHIKTLREEFSLNIDKLKSFEETSKFVSTYLIEKNKLRELNKNFITCSIHVRKTDYTTENNKNYYNQLNLDNYYRDAIDLIKSMVRSDKLKFIVFSDDINWCKNEFKDYDDFVYMNIFYGNYGGIFDLDLFKYCKHNIIANSSFSWWGAMLNENEEKIVIAPEKWYISKDENLESFNFGCDGQVFRI